MTDEQLRRLLQAAVPDLDDRSTTEDPWPLIAARLDSRPPWTPFDLALALVVVVSLALLPETFVLIALHL